jgi:hypothetical protein
MKLLLRIYLVSCPSGPVEWSLVQAYAVQSWLIGFPGHGVCSKFLIETITKRNE